MNKIIKILCFATLMSLVSCSGSPSSSESRPIGNTVNVYTVEGKEYSDLAEMIKNVKTSVVDINSYSATQISAGSGVIVGKSDNNYFIITNHHVIDNGTSFEVIVYGDNDISTTYNGTLIGGSPINDIAVISITSDVELNVANFGDSSKLEVGNEVVAIGNPLGILGGTVTKGIISSLEREVYISDIGYMKLLQTDAAINSGNSGGALFNKNGLLMGIVNSGYSSYEGLNFAIQGNKALDCFTSIVETCNDDHYGYVVGENNLGLSFSSSNIYTDSTLKEVTSVVYASSVRNDTCDAYVNEIKDYNSFINNKYNVFYTIDKINDVDIDSTSTAIKTAQNLVAGNSVTITYREISYKRSGGFFQEYYYYIASEPKTMTVPLTQFIYSI